MPKLPQVRPRELVRTLKKLGFFEYRQKGSHLSMIHPAKQRVITIPMHSRPLKKGTLAAILRQAGLAIEDIQ